MSELLRLNTKKESRVLLLSLRNIKFHVSRCYLYEFEDIIREVDSVDMLAPVFSPNLFKVTNRLANYAAKTIGSGKLLNPLFKQFNLDKEYDLFFANSLLRHDWVYRWEEILATVGLDNTSEMVSRKANLQNLAEMIATQESNHQKSSPSFNQTNNQGTMQFKIA